MEGFVSKFVKLNKAAINTLTKLPLLPSTTPTNALHATSKTYVDSNLPKKYFSMAVPAYVGASTFSVSRFALKSSDDTTNIEKPASTTVDISTNGLNGCAQSANLAGTIGTGGGSSTTITGSSTAFSTDFIVGDVIWTASGARRITAIASNTSLTVESAITLSNGTSYKRGGEAPNTVYWLYAITDGTTPGLLLSTRNVAAGETLSDLPAGYTKSRQVPFAVTNDASSNIIKFLVTQWGATSFILFDIAATSDAGTSPVIVLNGGSATSFTAVSAATFIPYRSVGRVLINYYSATGNHLIYVRPGDSSGNGQPLGFEMSSGSGKRGWRDLVKIDSTDGTFDYKLNAASGSASLDVLGYEIVGVN